MKFIFTHIYSMTFLAFFLIIPSVQGYEDDTSLCSLAEGQAYHFKLIRHNGSLPNIEIMGDPYYYSWISPGEEINFNLTVCLNSDDKVVFKKLTFKANFTFPKMVYTEKDTDINSFAGLYPAIQGDAQHLNIRLYKNKPNSRGVFEGIEIKSIQYQGENFIVTTNLYNAGEGWKLSQNARIIGHIKTSYKSFSQECNFFDFEDKRVKSFRLGLAEFKLTYCRKTLDNYTSQYKVIKVQFRLLPEQAAGNIRIPFITYQGESLAENFNYKWNKNNACDSFYLRIPEMGLQYAATTPAKRGCPTGVENAPIRNWSDESMRVLYRVNEGNGFGDTKKGPRGHFLKY